MRMRRKPFARPELNAWENYMQRPTERKNNHKSFFKNDNTEIYLELGCGKGGFISKLASQNKDKNFLAFDIKSEVLVLAKRNIEKEYQLKNTPIDNVFITSHDIARINLAVGEQDEISRIYINFCNPWPKAKHNKRRLTHTRQLEQYKTFLSKTGEIYFKTDDDDLFNDSLEYFKQANFELSFITYDLHSENVDWNIQTEHEKMFSEQGIKIKALIAHLK